MKIFLLTLLALSSVAVAAPKHKSAFVEKAPVKTTIVEKAPVVEVPVEKVVLPPGAKIRTAQQDAELKDWIIGIQKNAKDATDLADKAEKDAAESRTNLQKAGGSLKAAQSNADTLQAAIDAQTKQMNQAIADKEKAVAKEAKTAKENSFLKTILGLEAAAVTALLCLWLKVPNLSPPWGLATTIAAPVIVFGLIKVIL